MVQLYKGDCLIESDKIESGSVDLILTDLPYGNMNKAPTGWKSENLQWDITIEPKKVFDIANRILRKNGKMVLFSQEPYTTKLITEAIPNIPFGYRATWEKDNFANALGVNKNMVSFTEDILIFTKTNPIHDSEFIHPLRPYFQKVHQYIGESKKYIIDRIGQKADHVFRFNSSQFSLCTKETYELIIDIFNIDEMVDFKPFEILTTLDTPFKSKLLEAGHLINPSTFNLWEGKKYKSNILKYNKDYNGYHPTQKPILLLEDLVKTFSNENDLVVDLTMGSGSTGVACVNTFRKFIGIEMDANYFNVATKRIGEAQELNELL